MNLIVLAFLMFLHVSIISSTGTDQLIVRSDREIESAADELINKYQENEDDSEIGSIDSIDGQTKYLNHPNPYRTQNRFSSYSVPNWSTKSYWNWHSNNYQLSFNYFIPTEIPAKYRRQNPYYFPSYSPFFNNYRRKQKPTNSNKGSKQSKVNQNDSNSKLSKQIENDNQLQVKKLESNAKLTKKNEEITLRAAEKNLGSRQRKMPDYYDLLKSELRPSEDEYKFHFSFWRKEYSKIYNSPEEEEKAYKQFKKYFNLETYVEGELPLAIHPVEADQDLYDILNNKLKSHLKSEYNPRLHQIDLVEIFNDCKPKFYFYSQRGETNGKYREEYRFAVFQRNIYMDIYYGFLKGNFDPRHDRLCSRFGDRTEKEKEALRPKRKRQPLPKANMKWDDTEEKFVPIEGVEN